MDALIYLLIAVHVLLAIGLVIFVLLHSGKGTGLSSMFGGMSSAGGGTSIIEKNLDRITVGLAVSWALTSVLLMMRKPPSSIDDKNNRTPHACRSLVHPSPATTETGPRACGRSRPTDLRRAYSMYECPPSERAGASAEAHPRGARTGWSRQMAGGRNA